MRCSAIKKIDNGLHLTIVRTDNGALTYCLKEDTRVLGPFKFGIEPVRRNNKVDWNNQFEKAKKGEFDLMDP